MAKVIKVLVIDDSALVREILSVGLNSDPGIEVVGAAVDPFDAREKIIKLKPDVLTLDVEMPKMDGVEFLRQFMPQFPLPVVMVSSLTERGQKITLDALAAGAVDFVAKPKGNLAQGLQGMMIQLITKVKAASLANVSHWKNRKPVSVAHPPVARPLTPPRVQPITSGSTKVIVIGASTGGTEAIKDVLMGFPENTHGVVVTQHMPAGFTKLFADRLDSQVPMEVKEAEDGDMILPGRVLVARGEHQMTVVRSGASFKVKISKGERVNGHCPSVEVLMKSAAPVLGKNAVGIILTGMGGDGARGLKAMRKAGARTMAQDEASCVVFGMPKVAFETGGAEKLIPLSKIAAVTLNLLNRNEALV